MGKLKRTSEEVKEYFSLHECKLIDEYNGAMIPMSYVCRCGRSAKTSWNNFTKGKRCGYCHETGRKKKWTLEELRVLYKSKGCEFLETEYKNGWQLLLFRCSCGKEYKKSLHEFKKQPRCWDCYMASRSGEKHHAWVEDREELRLKQLFKKKCYKALASTLKATKRNKVGRTTDMLGYTPEQLRQHVESHPNWKVVKDKSWHLDHIFPIEAFSDYGIADIKLINRLDNLQPVTQTINNKKKDQYDPVLFERWLFGKI